MTTINRLMFENQEHGRQALTQQLGGSDLWVGNLSVEPPEVSGALVRAFDVPLGNLAVDGWEEHARVAHAKARTAANPGSHEVVELGEHQLSVRQNPVVEAWVGAAPVEVLRLELVLSITVTAVALTVEAGRIADVRPGPARARVVLSAAGRTLVSREFQPVDLTPSTLAATSAETATLPVEVASH